MSDKSEIEAIRARHADDLEVLDSNEDVCRESDGWEDTIDIRDLLAHVDALEARVAQLEGALRDILSGLERESIDFDCGDVEYIARAALAEVKP